MMLTAVLVALTMGALKGQFAKVRLLAPSLFLWDVHMRQHREDEGPQLAFFENPGCRVVSATISTIEGFCLASKWLSEGIHTLELSGLDMMKCPGTGHFRNLVDITFTDCTNLGYQHNLFNCKKVHSLMIDDCRTEVLKLNKLIATFSSLMNLELIRLTGLTGSLILPELKFLHIMYMPYPDICTSTGVQRLYLSYMTMASMASLPALPLSLEFLHLEEILSETETFRLGSLTNLCRLVGLYVCYCHVEEIGKLPDSLKILECKWCERLETLPDMANCTILDKVTLSTCSILSLEEFASLPALNGVHVSSTGVDCVVYCVNR
jgi:hypothetical protein